MLISEIIQLIAIVILLCFSALFSLSEIAIIGVSRSKIYKLKSEGDKRAIKLTKLRENKESLIGAILLCNTLVNAAATSIVTSLAIDYFGDNGEALLVATLAITLLILFYAEILPKTYAVRNSEKVALYTAGFYLGLVWLLKPFTSSIQVLVNLMLKTFTSASSKLDFSGMDMIKGAVEMHHEEGIVIPEDKYMLGGLIDLEKISVDEVMLHRNQIKSISIDKKAPQIIDFIFDNSHSRIPIWKGEPSNVIGILIQKDLSKLLKTKPLSEVTTQDIKHILRRPWFIPNLTNLKIQLQSFRENQTHFALVVNEYGELLGLITLEDILEEVVGQIEDEYDDKTSPIQRRVGNDSAVVLGDLSIRDLNREMHWEISDEHAATIGGLVLHLAKGVPAVGEKFKFGGFTLKVIKRHHNTITKVYIKHAKKTA
ncbi:MAG: HlyC/CorC family transporter [Gammaproteobacteria bacterium]